MNRRDTTRSDTTGSDPNGGRLNFVGPEPGRWLQQAVTTFGGTVENLLPASFPAFARVLHRIDPDGGAIRWSDVCALSGATAHSLMQWDQIWPGWSVHSTVGGRSGVEDPEEGNLDAISMAALYELLAAATTARVCFHGFWNGWGDLAFPPSVTAGPTLHLPGRDYLVFSGALDPALFVARPDVLNRPQSPSLTWPQDHSWCLATEIDLDSTVVGGSTELIAAILAHPALESWPIGPHDSLEFDGDPINLR